MLDRMSGRIIMDKWTLILLVFLVVGLGSVAFSSLLNRKPTKAARDARRYLEHQAQMLPNNDMDVFLASCGLTEKDVVAGRQLLHFLASLLRVSPDKLASDYPMRRLFSISNSNAVSAELKIDEPFSYDITEGISQLSDKKRWEEKWTLESNLPSNEEGLADFIMHMTVAELLRFFAPLVKSR